MEKTMPSRTAISKAMKGERFNPREEKTGVKANFSAMKAGKGGEKKKKKT